MPRLWMRPSHFSGISLLKNSLFYSSIIDPVLPDGAKANEAESDSDRSMTKSFVSFNYACC